MPDIRNAVEIAVDAYRGQVQRYTLADANEAFHAQLVEINGGADLNLRALRAAPANGLFTLMEEILRRTVPEGLKENDFFMQFVEMKNLREGDTNEWVLEDDIMYEVAQIADGTQGVRRQRLGGATTHRIPTYRKAVRVYEHLRKLLAKSITITDFLENVQKAFTRARLNDIYALWSNVAATDLGGLQYFPAAGAYDEDLLLETIDHVEAAAGGEKRATLITTLKGARRLVPNVQAEALRDDMYKNGVPLWFYGRPVMVIPQRHKYGTTDFQFANDVIDIVAGDDRPIKFIDEGEPLLGFKNPLDNADLTAEIFATEATGVGLLLAGGENAGIGRYTFTN
jgi:hypothetical protein